MPARILQVACESVPPEHRDAFGDIVRMRHEVPHSGSLFPLLGDSPWTYNQTESGL